MEGSGLKDLSDREILVLTYQSTKELNEKTRDHEARIRLLERLGSVLIGGLYVIQIILDFWRK